MRLIEDINQANYIVIEVDAEFLSSASALYTHILRLHKNVSLVCTSKEINKNLSFLPWFEKIRTKASASADLKIVLNMKSVQLFNLFKEHNIKPNQKMATALYAGLLQETDGFRNSNVNGSVFAISKELLEYGAEYKICTDFILKFTSLSLLRLKAILLNNMELVNNASVAYMSINENELKASASKIEDCYSILYEAFNLPYVKEVYLIKSDENKKILKTIKKGL
ncbi:MAG: phosphoesterase [Sulfurimonas sp.]|nr:MAG: phosphoesterase [Sulfurimonas sp.]